MDGPNFEIERHDQVLKGLGENPLNVAERFLPFAANCGGPSLLKCPRPRRGAAERRIQHPSKTTWK
jgi:hypothetical protein